ncbi:hypothetical protein CFN58_01160 [Pseudomonas avellanae]|uniref:Uncharacterized protein n=2 Tax=Pseudomonas syringae group TaxID=136849 RepID=A0A261WNY2_9PSED|nr:hypothetical protein CT122_22400 [Pseudomonas syringae pv. actinidiae]OZI87859.1 hypothetical protein CFN58_01160 [Pseudomonas avellanae]PIN58228.1 hypothetical protein CUB86_28685 [Pseudomonas syringae pv. actinidiae]
MAWSSWIPLLVAVCAAVMAFASGTLTERSKRRNSLRTEAYADYLSAVARSGAPGDRHKVLADAALAKCKIVIHGSAGVISALKAFETSGAVATTEEGRERLISLVVAMRGDSKVSRGDIASLLLGEPQSTVRE